MTCPSLALRLSPFPRPSSYMIRELDCILQFSFWYGVPSEIHPVNTFWDTVLALRNVEDRESSVGTATRYGLDGPGIESQWGARLSAPVQIGPGAHPAPYRMGNGSIPGQTGRGVPLTTHPLLASRLKKE